MVQKIIYGIAQLQQRILRLKQNSDNKLFFFLHFFLIFGQIIAPLLMMTCLVSRGTTRPHPTNSTIPTAALLNSTNSTLPETAASANETNYPNQRAQKQGNEGFDAKKINPCYVKGSKTQHTGYYSVKCNTTARNGCGGMGLCRSIKTTFSGIAEPVITDCACVVP